ncbi:SigE family RNA polymerase sigma factor [Dactylosporangium sp. AC04546]|uniref:SigE family RNA polymerase sigma factor n=1 Tax=Dactylosporangium sp. AC04546 TaxID=2862460 RepID=UPI001EDEE1AD|nr:SigE family RNA polymerase sigma factor [Dactylosporangium sp. AC04546]WVK80160.1 SigE family RNA polymerase sigma factor [Dactylosporangium sp. AC04546]
MPDGESEDQRQFREYFVARHEAVRRTAYVLCGDWHWADDLTQNAFMRLAVAWRTVRDREALDAFVRTCLVRAYLSDVRRVWRRREQSVADLPEHPRDGDDTASRVAFTAALRRLPARQRAVLVCRFYHDLDVEATAATLGCSAGTVKSQTARGLAKLRDLIGTDGAMTTVGEGR